MKIGLFVGAAGTDNIALNDIVAQGVQAEADGFDCFWMPHILPQGPDALTALALIGAQTERIALGAGVVPIHPRHPSMLAQAALSAQIAAGGRLTLGIGPSHKPGIENVLGLSYARPAQRVEEYLAVLRPLIDVGAVDFDGDFYNVHATLHVPDRLPISVMVAALAPRMLRIAGAIGDGTVTWMAGVRAIDSHVAPRINAAAADAGRPTPRICVGLPVAVTDDIQAGQEQATAIFGRYSGLTNYRRIMDVEEASGVGAVSVIGDEAEVERQIRAFADAGATEFVASVFPVGDDADASVARTRALLRSLVG